MAGDQSGSLGASIVLKDRGPQSPGENGRVSPSQLSTERKTQGRPAARSAAYRRRRDSATTKLRIVTTAERLYAERGIDGVSLREISEASGQRNTAVVQYHFGSRDGLIAAIFENGSALVDALRAPLVAQLRDDQPLVDLSSAIVRPFAATVAQDSHYVSFLARLMADHDLRSLTAAGISVARPSFRLLSQHLDARLQDLPKRVREARAATVVEFTVSALASYGRAGPTEPLLRLSFDRYADDLVQVVAGMLAAPSATSPSGNPGRGRLR
jgi:AcrR family transcriptional regulator